MDKSLGDLMDWVEAHGEADRTIILFMSDNGGFSCGSKELEEEITRVSARYGQDIVVLYADLDANKTPMEMADDYFDYNGYGIGAERSGVLLLVAPATYSDRKSVV